MNTKIVDFENSFLQWEQNNIGRFSLCSVLTILSYNQKIEKIGLSKNVLAGNMFVENNLLKFPPYFFQVGGNENEQFIFRSFLNIGRKFPVWKKKITLPILSVKIY